MKKNVLLYTNFLVCAVIVIGFVITAFIGYRSNQSIFRQDMESVSVLTSEGIYHEIDSIFTKPVNISMTMANDRLLKDFLEGEEQHLGDEAFVDTMRNYLNDYRDKYDYDSVFLASAASKRYYYYNGLDRMLEQGDPENVWFYDFLEGNEESSVNIDNDQVAGAGNEVTVFINCRISGADGKTIGIVGVGFRVDYLQSLLKSYEDKFGIKAYLVNQDGMVEISTKRTRYEGAENLFEDSAYADLKDSLLRAEGEHEDLWYNNDQGSGVVIGQYISNLDWHLIVSKDTTALNRKLAHQLIGEILIVLAIIIIVLVTITNVIRRYNRIIIELTIAKEQAHRTVFQKATEQLYEDIYELDITHDRAASEAAESYFKSMDVPQDTPYGESIKMIAKNYIKEEYRQGYLDTFCTENVLNTYKKGIDKLRYDFMLRKEDGKYCWMRITAQIFFWAEDNSVRMMSYHQDIDEEKRRELYMAEQMQNDSLTGLYNKAATQDCIRQMLIRRPAGEYAFFILDIDDFKAVNDTLGHAAGDKVLIEFAKSLKAEFRSGDVVGRIGGDEFIAFMPVLDGDAVEEKARELSCSQCREVSTDAGTWHISASIGVAAAPSAGGDFETLYKKADQALYETKKRGKNGFTVFKV